MYVYYACALLPRDVVSQTSHVTVSLRAEAAMITLLTQQPKNEIKNDCCGVASKPKTFPFIATGYLKFIRTLPR